MAGLTGDVLNSPFDGGNGSVLMPEHGWPQMTCRMCERKNPFVFYAPKKTTGGKTICVCHNCAGKAGWLTPDGDVRPDVSF